MLTTIYFFSVHAWAYQRAKDVELVGMLLGNIMVLIIIFH